MSILICLPESMCPIDLKNELLKIDSSLEVEIGHESIKNIEKIEFAIVWNQPKGLFLNFPNLKAILVYGHGVDSVLSDNKLPQGIPIVRLKSDKMADLMNEYLLAIVLLYRRQLIEHSKNIKNFEWGVCSRLDINSIGILGLGFLGKSAANHFLKMGFNISGWNKTGKKIKNIRCYKGKNGLIKMMKHSDFLINLLPLTKETKYLLNYEILSKLKKGGYLINVGRGHTLNEEDLIKLLDNGHLSGACLDVFQNEPLPKNHPFWKHKKILITPHNSCTTPHSSVAKQIIENYRRSIYGEKLLNLVNLDSGY